MSAKSQDHYEQSLDAAKKLKAIINKKGSEEFREFLIEQLIGHLEFLKKKSNENKERRDKKRLKDAYQTVTEPRPNANQTVTKSPPEHSFGRDQTVTMEWNGMEWNGIDGKEKVNQKENPPSRPNADPTWPNPAENFEASLTGNVAAIVGIWIEAYRQALGKAPAVASAENVAAQRLKEFSPDQLMAGFKNYLTSPYTAGKSLADFARDPAKWINGKTAAPVPVAAGPVQHTYDYTPVEGFTTIYPPENL